jgi:hypothetical protein
MKAGGFYLEHRFIYDDIAIAVENIAQGRGLVLIGTRRETIAAFEYHSITSALGAWFAWDALSGKEPTGYEVKRG